MNCYTNEKLQKKTRQKTVFLIFLLCSGVLLAGLFFYACTTDGFKQFPLEPKETSKPSETAEPPLQVSPSEVSSAGEDTTSSGDVSVTENALPETIYINYDFSLPVPESEPVDLSYFDNAVFIGDSRTEGFILNLSLSQVTAYAQKGLMVNTIFTDKVIDKDNQKISIMDALKETSFSKVYIMLGINELGWTYSSKFIEKYGQIIDEIRAINPNAVIYVQSILPVSQKVSTSHDYIQNDKIVEYNSLLLQMCAEKQVFYVDCAASVVDETGCLPDNAATDGIHLKKQYCEKWLEYLETHTVSGSNL